MLNLIVGAIAGDPTPTAPVAASTPVGTVAAAAPIATATPAPAPAVAPTVAPTMASTPTATPLPPSPTVAPTTAVAAVPTPTIAPAATATPASFRTGGFGRTRAEWERTYGQPERDTGGALTYARGSYVVIYKDDRVAHLERIWGDRDAKSLDFATGAMKPLLPSDATRSSSYTASGGRPVDLYHSPTLAGLFPPAAFINGQPGEFVVLYRARTDGKVTSFVMGLGNNP